MADLEAFRSQVREWLLAHVPPSLFGRVGSQLEGVWGGRKASWPDPDARLWLERAAERGWTAPTWPTQYGGGGLSSAEARILAQVLRELRVPPPLIGFGLTMIGPTLLQFGREDQKREHLPPICRGEIRWCQGYSEPDAGSDLASLRTRAERDGDCFVVTGTKVWTSYADQSDWIFALVRSDPRAAQKQDGITFLLIDMDSPGVSVRPIPLISGSSPFCETRFDHVRVPVRHAVGEIHGGWPVAKALLGYERNMIAEAFGASGAGGIGERKLSLPELAREHLGSEDGRLADPLARDRVAALEMSARAFALTAQRARDAAKAGHKPGPESSIFKIAGTELNKQRMELLVEILGPQGLGWEGEGFAPDELAATRDWLRSRGNSIEGGTTEIQLNIIAKRVLGLPD